MMLKTTPKTTPEMTTETMAETTPETGEAVAATAPHAPARSIRDALRFAGSRTLFWLGMCVAASFILSLVEVSITALIQILLKTLGVLAVDAQGFALLNRFTPSVWNLSLALLVVGVLRSLGQFFVHHGSSVALENMNARLKLLVIYDTLESERTQSVSAGRISFLLSEVFPKASQFCYFLALNISYGLQCVALIVLMLATAWREALVGLVGLGLVGMVIIAIGSRVRAAAAHIPIEQSRLTQGIERVARNWLLVQALRTKRREYGALLRNVLEYSRHSLRTITLSNTAASGTPFFGIVLIMAMLILSRTLWHTPGLAVVSCLYLFVRLTQNIQASVTNFGYLNAYLPQFREGLEFFCDKDPREVAIALAPARPASAAAALAAASSDAPQTAADSAFVTCAPPILVENLSFTYAGQKRPAVQNLSFSVAAGSQCALVGPSGSGKSTLLALVLGLLEPQRGAVRIDGVSPRQLLSRGATRVGYVGPDPFIIEGSIKENLDYGRRLAVEPEAYWDALRAADLGAVVAELPGGLSYRLTSQADGLSAGQKQRLALARALLNRPHFLILDEPSANLDDESEAQIARSIERLKGQTTVLLVSHRRGILRFADAIIELSN